VLSKSPPELLANACQLDIRTPLTHEFHDFRKRYIALVAAQLPLPSLYRSLLRSTLAAVQKRIDPNRCRGCGSTFEPKLERPLDRSHEAVVHCFELVARPEAVASIQLFVKRKIEALKHARNDAARLAVTQPPRSR